jgi:hypothetical protein
MSSRIVGPRRGKLLLALAVAPLAGCFAGFQPSLLTLHGLQKPVMLTSVDRIGGGAALATQKAGAFEGESVSIMTQSQDQNYSYSYEKVNNVEVVADAQKALDLGGPDSEIKVTTLRAWARGWPAGVKNTVYIQGDVVKVGGGK